MSNTWFILGGCLFLIYLAIIVGVARYRSAKYGKLFFMRLMAERTSITSEELQRKYFEHLVSPANLPGNVRHMMAEYSGLSEDKILPDDDLWYFFRDLEFVDLMIKVEACYGIKFSESELSTVRCSLRSIVELIDCELQHQMQV